jgi:hypothetical protein
MGLDVIMEELESMSKVLGLMRGTLKGLRGWDISPNVLLHMCFIQLL